MSQFHFDPSSYAEMISADVPAYAELQAQIADASSGITALLVLGLGASYRGAAAQQIRWLADVGLRPDLVWERDDLAVLRAERP